MLRVALLLCLALSCRGGKGPGGALRRRLHAGRAERHPRALAGREARRHARPAGGDREPPRAEVVLYSRLAYDPLKDFSPVALVAIQPNILVVHPSGPASSVRELIAYARQQPGKLNYASSGAGAAAHLAGELFKSMTGVDMVDVPYKGAQPALTDVIAGQCQLMFATSASVIPYFRAGRVRALAVTAAQRSPGAPELPAIAESGVPGFEALDRLNGLGAEVAAGTPQDFAAYIAREIPKWTKVVRDSGAKAE